MAAARVLWYAAFSVIVSFVCAEDSLLLTRDEVYKLSEGEWMVEFFAPWCPACQAFSSVWQRFAEWSQGKEVNVVQVDVDAEVGLSAQFMITSLPSVYHIVDGEVRKMESARSYDDLVSYVEDGLWKKADPTPWWKSPLSLHFQVLGKLVDVTKFAKSAYDILTRDYGYSNMTVFAMAIVATILFGFTLGAILVGCSELCGKLWRKKEQPVESRQGGERPPAAGDREGEGSDEKRGKGQKTPEVLLPTSTVGQSSSDTSSPATAGQMRRRQVKIEYEEDGSSPKDAGAASKKKSPKQGNKKRMKAGQ